MPIMNEDDRIHLLQDNLRTLRLLAGWTLDDFGGKLSLTKATVSRFENNKVVLTRPMYIAIRAVFNEECTIGNNDILKKAIPLLLREDEAENLSDTEYDGIRKTLEAIAAASSGHADKGILANIVDGAISLIPSIATIGGVAAATYVGLPWLTRLLNNDKDS